LGLIVVQGLYCYKFLLEIWHVVQTHQLLDESGMMLAVLGLVDMAMIANLINMVTIGSESVFVGKLHLPEDKLPQWLNNMSSGMLKIKMSTSLVGVTGIHLLKSFVSIDQVPPDALHNQMYIHGMFLLSSLVLAVIERVNHPHTPSPSQETHHQ
jgi:uncharacterized protein (TIGR00645 family)